jgi:hypothetical protein
MLMNCILFTQAAWFWGSHEPGKSRQPDRHRARVAIDDVVYAGGYLQRCNGCSGGILDVNEGEHSGARFNDRILALPDLQRDAAILWIVVGTRPVEEAISQSNTLEARIAEEPVLDLRVGRDGTGNSRRGFACEIVAL